MSIDFKDRQEKWVLVYSHGDRTTRYTKIGQLHADMIKRCTENSPEQRRHPNYYGCHMSETFKNANLFGDWVVKQIGYNENGYQLDKDILLKGNKFYSEDTCVFVPNALNKFFTKRQNCRGPYPIGVSWTERLNKYQVSFTANRKSVYLGVYSDINDAFNAYKSAKESESKRLAEFYTGLVDERVINALMTYEVEMTD